MQKASNIRAGLWCAGTGQYARHHRFLLLSILFVIRLIIYINTTLMPAKRERTTGARKKTATIIKMANFPVVGIGASAGGLEAFESFFKVMPEDSGMSFVLVAHLDPSHTSILPEIIQRKTRMKVLQVVDNMRIVPNQVFIIPPNKDLALLNGTLQLLEMRIPRGVNLPIDNFFRSLAQDQGNKAIAIILSGTGTDGTLGIRAIKGEAGMVMVQDPESAKYDGMPRNAIASGLVDYILPPDRMPEQLISYVRRQVDDENRLVQAGDENISNALQKIYVLLRASTEHDFSLYKKNTICRRIERRMHIQQIDHIDDYVRYLQKSEIELKILFKELLIGVTSFFRDPASFELLKEKYLPDLLRDKPDDYQVRVWVPGCSSGEEAYTIAIIIRECMEAMGRRLAVQIFGTDLDEDAINIARGGRYPESIAADIGPERLRKFFTRDDGWFQIKKALREMVVFAPQNIIKDPPFTRLDLLCCRNLLIYFGSQLQNRLFPVFHYSLKEDGLLFLGSSETISQNANLFTVLDKKWKIFKCRPSTKSAQPMLKFPVAGETVAPLEKSATKLEVSRRKSDPAKLLKAILAESNMPPWVIIDESANIVYVHGKTGRFLEPAEGEASTNVLEMARPGLRSALTSAFHRVAIERQEVKMSKLRIEDGGTHVDFDLTVKLLPESDSGFRGLMMVVFDERTTDKGQLSSVAVQARPEKKSGELKRIEDELRYTRENLQSTIEEMETSNEELKSANEELQSTNEELQSTNEELETSKEELQSLNEESVTVNAELQSRIDELVAANDDIKNLLDATEIATIFLDIDLNVRRFTPKATDFFHLTSADIGRPIQHFATTLKNVRLVEYAEKVLNDLGQHESEVGSEGGGHRYRMRVRPYRTLNNVIDGVVVTFEDISKYKELVDALTENEMLWRGLVENAPMGVFIMTNRNFAYLNPGACELFGASSPGLILNKSVFDKIHQDSHEMLTKQIDLLIQDRKSVSAVEQKWLRVDGTPVELVMSATPIIFEKKESALVFVREKL